MGGQASSQCVIGMLNLSMTRYFLRTFTHNMLVLFSVVDRGTIYEYSENFQSLRRDTILSLLGGRVQFGAPVSVWQSKQKSAIYGDGKSALNGTQSLLLL